MKPNRFEKIALGLAGVTALAIGTMILSVPHSFYASYGIVLGSNPNLLSELRAPGAGLAVSGLVMLLGLWSQTIRPASIAFAMTVFLAFPGGRLVSLALDGVPSSSVLGALIVEVAIGCLCLLAFRRRMWPSRDAASEPYPAE